MSILKSNKTVVGLFDSAKNVERATKALDQHGFGEENDDTIKIIDQDRLRQAQDQEITVPPASGLGGIGHSGVGYDPGPTAGAEAISLEKQTKETLTAFGVEEEQAVFYARQVARGSKLIVVETAEERAAEALQILEEISARSSMA